MVSKLPIEGKSTPTKNPALRRGFLFKVITDYCCGRSSRGRASLTTNGLPSTSLPLNISIAFFASSSVDISTKPKPLDRPEYLSEITFAETIVPAPANSSSNFLLSMDTEGFQQIDGCHNGLLSPQDLKGRLKIMAPHFFLGRE